MLCDIVVSLCILVVVFWFLHRRYRKTRLRKGFQIAVETGDEKKVVKLLEQGANVNDLDSGNCNSLHIAIKKGHYKLIPLLIEAGVDTQQERTYLGYKPIHIIPSSLEKWRCLMELIKYNVPLDSTDNLKNNLLHLFVQYAPTYPHVMLTLITHGVDPNASNIIGYNPLHYLAATPGCGCQTARLLAGILVGNGANMNAQCLNRGLTPLHLAVIHKKYIIVDYLLNNGALLNLRDFENNTAFDHLFENENMPAPFIVLFMKHIILRKHRGEHIEQTIISRINSSPLLESLRTYFEDYLRYLKNSRISPYYKFTYYDVLCDNKYKVAKYLAIPAIFNSYDFNKLMKGSYYNEVYLKLKVAREILEFRNFAFVVTNNILVEKQLPYLCIQKISSFFHFGDLMKLSEFGEIDF